MKNYGVYLSDPAADEDRLIDRFVLRSAALRLASNLNRLEMQRHRARGGRGSPPVRQSAVPLYYVCRDSMCGDSGRSGREDEDDDDDSE